MMTMTAVQDMEYNPYPVFRTSLAVIKDEEDTGKYEIKFENTAYSRQYMNTQLSALKDMHDELPKVLTSTKVIKTSSPYANFILNRNLTKMLDYLIDLKNDLESPAGAVSMTYFRDKLKETWAVKESLPRDKVLTIVAIEEAIKGRRWRDLNLAQINTLEKIIQNLLKNTSSLKSVLSSIHSSGIEIYPSAEIDDEEEKED